jgi:uncharacterized protein YciI
MIKGFSFLLITVIICCSFNNNKQNIVLKDASKNDTTPPVQMKQYWLVFLLKGSNRGQDSITAAKIQDGHMANIERLAKQGSIVMAGPMGYDKDLRGIFIMDAKDSATAANLVKTDPAIIAGRLRFEIHPWWAAKGTYQFK